MAAHGFGSLYVWASVCVLCLRSAPSARAHLPALAPVASLRWRSSLAPVVSAYCCAFIVMAMFFVVSFGGIVKAAPPPLPTFFQAVSSAFIMLLPFSSFVVFNAKRFTFMSTNQTEIGR